MTRQEFINHQGPDFADLFLLGYDAVPCSCGENVCPEWQILRRSELPHADVWLDDLGPHDKPYSRPVPDGWVHVRSVEQAKAVFASHNVQRMSLDHDLGACKPCKDKMLRPTTEDWLIETDFQSMPHCEHVGTGATFVLWMAENDIWPKERPDVHSANPVGAARMKSLIERYFPKEG